VSAEEEPVTGKPLRWQWILTTDEAQIVHSAVRR